MTSASAPSPQTTVLRVFLPVKEYEAALPRMLKSERRIMFLRPPMASYSKA
jgi:hypothetical protein